MCLNIPITGICVYLRAEFLSFVIIPQKIAAVMCEVDKEHVGFEPVLGETLIHRCPDILGTVGGFVHVHCRVISWNCHF